MFRIGNREIGAGRPCYVVAEISANHNQDINECLRLMDEAKRCGADAVKFQTYTPDTMTLDCKDPVFRVGVGTLWEGRYLYDLYGEAHTPWDWFPRLKSHAGDIGIDWFSTPFDDSAVDFLERLDPPAHKVASFELVDIPLIRKIARTKRPMIMSTGMASLQEVEEAVRAAREEGNRSLVLLKCTSAYPAPPEEMNLRTIPDLAARFGVPVGLSDHTLGTTAAVAAVALGACVIEKHFTMSRQVKGPDSEFSLEPAELMDLVRQVRVAEKALGRVQYEPSERESKSKAFRRSLFVTSDVRAGEALTKENVRSIRPSNGLPPKCLPDVLGKVAVTDLKAGTPLSWELIKPR